MNGQTDISPGQVPNEGGLPKQDGNAVPPNQMQNLVVGVAGCSIGVGGSTQQQHNMINAVDPELLRARSYLRDKIYAVLLQRYTRTVDDSQRTRFRNISKRLEEGLFNAAPTKEEYLNIETLEHRLSGLIKDRAGNSHNERHQQLADSSSSVDEMILSPGMSQSSTSSTMDTSSVDSSDTAASGVQSNSFHRSDGL